MSVSRTCLCVILAAGEGSRMQSAQPKVLHTIASFPIIGHVLDTVFSLPDTDVAIVVQSDFENIHQVVKDLAPEAQFFVQHTQKGTADAVFSVDSAVLSKYDDILVLYGDTPFIDRETLCALRDSLAQGCSVSICGFYAPNPLGYGRIIQKDELVCAIREEKDCSKEEKEINFCNAGLMGFSGKAILKLLSCIECNNDKGEFYLTDSVEVAYSAGLDVGCVRLDSELALGINTREDLAYAETLWQQKKRREIMSSGVTLIAPETVFFSYDTCIGYDTVIEPYVIFGSGVTIASGVRVKGFSYIEGAFIAAGSHIGPYARLRLGTHLEENVKIGNFVEIKQAVVEKGAKINHLSYVGDARVGSYANIGAGCITCNYDGYEKFFTEIGSHAFIGSNSSLVAPLSIGEGAYVASGSVITENVPDNALVFGRARQIVLPNRASRIKKKKEGN